MIIHLYTPATPHLFAGYVTADENSEGSSAAETVLPAITGGWWLLGDAVTRLVEAGHSVFVETRES